MNLTALLPTKPEPDNPDDLQNIVKNIIYLTNYFPAARTALGWKGVFRIAHELECWTIKIKSSAGVYGFICDRSESTGEFITSSFALFYFPDPEEEIIDALSLMAALITQRHDYITLVREFPYHDDFFDYFHIGDLYISYSKKSHSIFTGIRGRSYDRIISKDGVTLPDDDSRYLVSPGEAESNFPSFYHCSLFFEVFASSLSRHLEEPPSSLYYRTDPGIQIVYGKYSPPVEIEAPDILEETLVLGFGDESVSDHNSFSICMIEKPKQPLQSLAWIRESGEPPDKFSGAMWWRSCSAGATLSIDKSLLGISSRPALYIVTGFLGSGKTTFIKNFIEFQMQKYLFTAVIQNELGEIGLDGLLLSDNSRVLEMDEGCVCCTLSGNLRKGIKKILDDFSPDCIVLETSGAANPSNLLDEIDELGDLVRFDSVTTIVDATNIIETLKSYGVAREQIRTANILVLNKMDIAGEENKNKIIQTVTEINNRALVITAINGVVNPSLIYDSDENGPHPPERLTGKHDHLRDGLGSVSIRFEKRFNRNAFKKKIDSLGEDIFRIKGIVSFDDTEAAQVFQYVCGRYDLTPYDLPADSDRYLVFIGKNLDVERLECFFDHP